MHYMIGFYPAADRSVNWFHENLIWFRTEDAKGRAGKP